MKTTYTLKAHVNPDGTVVSDETVPLPPGPVDIRVSASAGAKTSKSRISQGRQHSKLVRMMRKAHKVKCPAPPKDGRSIDEVLYGA
jgi:hypothetical protein